MISIVIPTYEMNGVGKTFLENSLKFISNQSFKFFEVVISDHSISYEIEGVCKMFSELNIKYIKNEHNRGSSSANLNNAILNSSFELVKILMQDEYIFDKNTLNDIVKVFEEKTINWVITGCFYGDDVMKPKGNMIPYYNDKIIEGKNTIGSPSVLTFRKTEDLELFDPNLIWMMDCEYYKRLYNKWGQPKIIPEHKIFVNQHKNQLTNIIEESVKVYETNFVKNKYKN